MSALALLLAPLAFAACGSSSDDTSSVAADGDTGGTAGLAGEGAGGAAAGHVGALAGASGHAIGGAGHSGGAGGTNGVGGMMSLGGAAGKGGGAGGQSGAGPQAGASGSGGSLALGGASGIGGSNAPGGASGSGGSSEQGGTDQGTAGSAGAVNVPSTISFAEYRLVPSGGDHLALGDLDGDGKLDLVSVTAQGLSAALGHGDGTFASAVPLAGPPSSVDDVLIADTNGDGKGDVAAVSDFDSSLTVFLGAGDGTFAKGVAISTGTQAPHAIAAGDVDGNGSLDLVVANPVQRNGGTNMASAGNSVLVFLGKGDGTFKASTSFTVGTGPSEILLLDFDGDKVLDVATLNVGYNNFAGDQTVTVAYGAGDGTFPNASTLSAVGGDGKLISFAASDVTSDGRLDIMSSQAHGFDVWVGQTKGFAKAVYTPVTSKVVQMFTGDRLRALDVDADGKNDLVSPITQHGFAVFRGDGTGAFAAPNLFGGPSDGDLVTGDVDGNGSPDILFGASPAELALSYGDGTFIDAKVYDSGGVRLLVGDLNGDPRADVIGYTEGSGGQFCAALGMVDGTLGVGKCLALGQDGHSAMLADANGDTFLDFISISGNNPLHVSVWPGDGTGAFGASIITSSSASGDDLYSKATVGDLDGDGKIDLVVGLSSNELYVRLGKGDGTFADATKTTIAGDPGAVALVSVADVDGDGKGDVVLVLDTMTASFLKGLGDGTFAPARDVALPTTPVDGLLQDLDGDGHLDLAIAGSIDALAVILRGDGAGAFAVAQTIPLEARGYSLSAADFDHDGKIDLAASAGGFTTPLAIDVLPSTASGLFGLPISVPANGWACAYAGDVDGDGKPDLALGCSDASVGIVRNLTP